jgi:hypothetical protein
VIVRWNAALWAAFFALCAIAAPAQAASSGVRESADPARAASVERAAAELKRRPAQTAVGVVHDKTALGYAMLGGGISPEDRVQMHAQRSQYSLWVVTVAKPSGAYLADVQLRIVDSKSKAVVLDRTMQGPWLLLKLPPAPYDLTATFRATAGSAPQTLTSHVNVSAKGLRQAVLRFDSTATVGPEMQGPFNGDPFGAPAASAPRR